MCSPANEVARAAARRCNEVMTLGRSPAQEDLFRSTRETCEARLPERSNFRLLAARSHELFPDESFADLFMEVGRNSVPPRIVAVVMVLQRYTGMSDREAADAFSFDARWKYAAGALDFDHPSFVHTVLGCSLRAQCTDSPRGRVVSTHPKHHITDRQRKRQRDPDWKWRYRATRPKVERKLAHMMRRKHGGRRARVRGRLRVAHDFALLAAATNLARLAILCDAV